MTFQWSEGKVVGGQECCCDGEEQDRTGGAGSDQGPLASAGVGGEDLGSAVDRRAELGMPDRVSWGKDRDPVGPGAACGEDVSAPLPPPRKNSQPLTVLPPPARSMAAQFGLAAMPRVMKVVPFHAVERSGNMDRCRKLRLTEHSVNSFDTA